MRPNARYGMIAKKMYRAPAESTQMVNTRGNSSFLAMDVWHGRIMPIPTGHHKKTVKEKKNTKKRKKKTQQYTDHDPPTFHPPAHPPSMEYTAVPNITGSVFQCTK